MKRNLLALLLLFLLPSNTLSARNQAKERDAVLAQNHGYYKELFMNGGIALTSRRTLPAADALGLKMEFFASATGEKISAVDTLTQQQIFCGYSEDSNGWLLYPDGAPRYRAIYVNGGHASTHAVSLTELGRKRIQEFVAAGGSYVGTCAGAYFATAGSKRSGKGVINRKIYLHLWPGIMHSTHLNKSQTPLRIERKSPLLRYYDFGGDYVVDSVRHNGGGYALGEEAGTLPEKTEVLARYVFKNNSKVQIDNKPAIWAYKGSENSGRAVLIGSHPEAIKRGERLELMSAALLYAMDGNAKPQVKGVLTPNQLREMCLKTEDNKPEYTRIGDRQYHHFEITVPKHCQRLVISLNGYKGEDNFDLTLCAKSKELAFAHNAPWKVETKGCNKELVIEKPKAGKWFISVYCATAVGSFVDEFGTTYTGRTDVLNGVPYSVKATLF